MAIQFHPLPTSVFAAGQKWYIQRLNSELREIFALEGTLRAPRRARRSDLTITRRGEVQVHVSRISDQAVDSSLVNADTLDGLDSTQFLRSDTSDTGTGTYTLSNANPLDLVGNIVTTIDFGVDNATRSRLDFNCINPSNTGAQFRFLAVGGEFLDYVINTTGAFFATKSGMDMDFSALGVGSSIQFQTAGKMTLDSTGADLDIDAGTSVAIDAATSMTIDTAAGALDITSVGGNLTLKASDSTDLILLGNNAVTLDATQAALDIDAATDITIDAGAGDILMTATGGVASLVATGGDITLDASGAGDDIILDTGAGGVISIPTSGTLDFGTTAAMVFTSATAAIGTYAFLNTHAVLGAKMTMTLGGVAGNKLSLDTTGVGGAALFEIECVDEGISLNGAATFDIRINDDGVDCDTVIETENLTEAFEVDASEDRVMVESRDILRYALLTA